MHFDQEQLGRLTMLREGGQTALVAAFEEYRTRLQAMVAYRMPDALKRRIDASDVMQDTFVEASRRLPGYLENPALPIHVWLRQIARNVISSNYRFHTLAAKRSTERETPIRKAAYADVDSLVAFLSDSIASPLSQVANAEIQHELRRVLESMDEVDREILCLKQLEQLSFADVAAELEIDVSAAKRRFQRAAIKLRHLAAYLNNTSHAC